MTKACVDCGRIGPMIKARGLCSNCYKSARRSGLIQPRAPRSAVVERTAAERSPRSWGWPFPEPPTRAPCVGQEMDFDGLKPHELVPARNVVVEEALALCATCPDATRAWCLTVMDPRGAGKEWQGVAGGAVWSHGRLVHMPIEEMAS